MFDDDDDLGPFTSSGGMPGGMPGSRPSSSRRSPRASAQPTQPSEILKPLPLSLEDLYQGVAAKRMKVSRKLLSGVTEDKVSSPCLKKGLDADLSVWLPDFGDQRASGLEIWNENPFPSSRE